MKHMTAWTALNKGYADAAARDRSFGVGVWHEIYQVCFGIVYLCCCPYCNALMVQAAILL